MKQSDFSMTLLSNLSPGEVFDAIREVRAWWSGYYDEEIIGETKQLGDEFDFRAHMGPHFTRMKLVEVIPDQKVVWLVTESELGFVEDREEWTGTRVVFDIDRQNGQTVLRFTHEGLVPAFQCYEACAPAWALYLENKLLPMINRQ